MYIRYLLTGYAFAWTLAHAALPPDELAAHVRSVATETRLQTKRSWTKVRNGFAGRPADLALVLRELSEATRTYEPDDRRYDVLELLLRAAAQRSAWPKAEWDQYRDEISELLSLMLEPLNERNKRTRYLVDLKVELDLFTARDLPHLLRSFFNYGYANLTTPFVRIMASADEAGRELFRKRFKTADGNRPLLVRALAYDTAGLRDATYVASLILSYPPERLKTVSGSVRSKYATLAADRPDQAERYRLTVNVLLVKVFRDLHRRFDVDPSMKRALKNMNQSLALKNMGEAERQLLDNLVDAIRTGQGLEALVEIPKRPCSDSLASRRSP